MRYNLLLIVIMSFPVLINSQSVIPTNQELIEYTGRIDFSITPDLICINLGTNDFSTMGGDSALYVDGYLKFIDQIQTKYSNPEIICLLGPMAHDETLKKLRKYLNLIIYNANKQGKGRVHFFEMSDQKSDLDIGVDYHPTIEQHKRNAEELTNFIKSLKGW